MCWVDLRRDIGETFAELTPTQWTALSGAFRYKHPQYWDNRGDVYNRPRPSGAYQWQADILHARLRLEAAKWERNIRRRRLLTRFTNCGGCDKPLEHDGHVNVRVYCNVSCQYLADKKRADAIERKVERRHCVICASTFVVDAYRQQTICGSNSCRRERRRRYNQSRKRAA